MSDDVQDRNPIEALAEEFAALCRKGANPSIEDYAAKHPHLADEIRELFPPVAMMEDLKRRRQTVIRPRTQHILSQVGEYRIIRELGRGGTGIVYEAQQSTLGRRVALKVLHRNLLLDPTRLLRFQRESKAVAQLHHTSIVPVFGMGESGGLYFMVMQFIDGRPLDEILERFRKPAAPDAKPINPGLPQPPSASAEANPEYWRWAAKVCVQVADALHYAHQQGTRHCGIKPGNIMLDPHGAAWVCDFGTATLSEPDIVEPAGIKASTEKGVSPEKAKFQADARADVYSLGLVLYELLTLRSALADSVAGKTLVSPRALIPSVPRDLESVALKAIATDPRQRYQHAAELADDLQRFLDEQPVSARRVTRVERLVRWCRRNRTLAALSALSAASILLALIVGWVGYAKTSDALSYESRYRAAAEDTARRADETVQASLKTFDEIVNRLDQMDALQGGRPFPPPEHREGPGDFSGGPPRRDSQDMLAMLQSLTDFYARLAEKNPASANLQFEAASAGTRIGNIQLRLGENEKGEAQLRRAVESANKLHADFSENSDFTDLAAQSNCQYGIALLHRRNNKSSEAEPYLRRALSLATSLADTYVTDPRYRTSLAQARLAMADWLLKQDRESEAAALAEQITRDLADLKPDPRFRRTLGPMYRMLSELHFKLGAKDAAFDAQRAAQDLQLDPPPDRRRPPPGPP